MRPLPPATAPPAARGARPRRAPARPRLAAAAAAALLATLALAGCADPEPAAVQPGAERPPPREGLGAIAGLLVDDRYRPVPEGRVVLFPLGLETTTDAVGQFAFYDLKPGAYELHAQADGHEAAPVAIDVEEGVYAETEVEARRVFSDLSHIVTEQYSIFVPCAVSAVFVAAIMKCVLDGADSYHWGFSSDYSVHNATYLVSEFLASQPDGYMVRWGDCRDLARNTFEGTYTSIVLKAGDRQNGTIAWTNACPLGATLFYVGSAGDTTKQFGFDWGVGARFAIKGRFLNTVFIGPPEVDPLAYGALRPRSEP